MDEDNAAWADLDALETLAELDRQDAENEVLAERIRRVQLDLVGPWSVRKGEMVAYYAELYSLIVRTRFATSYVDGYANRGLSRLRGSDEVVDGSALRVLNVQPPFGRYFLVEADPKRAADLRDVVHARFGARKDVDIREDDANVAVPAILSDIRYDRFERALAFLDPYNMHGLKWSTIMAAGQNVAVDAIIHFPTMDANRTVLKRQHGTTSQAMVAKMSAYWGDASWEDVAYSTSGLLPLEGLAPVRSPQDAIIGAFRQRLRDVAGFKIVGKPIPMRNTKGGTLYHLLFASHNAKASDVMKSLDHRFGA